METTLQTCENQKRLLPFTPTPEENLSENPYKAIKIWKRLSHAIFAFVISYLAFLFFNSNPPYSPSPKPYLKTYLNQITNISMQLNKNTIQASSLHDQFFPLLISRKIKDITHPLKTPVDLLCIFDFSRDSSRNYKEQTEHVKRLLKEKIFPRMNNQDRLSVVLLDDFLPDDQILRIIPFTNVAQNEMEILFAIGEDIMRGKEHRRREDTYSAMRILSQRNRPNQVTGVFLFTQFHGKDEVRVDYLKEYFGLEDQSMIIKVFSTKYKELDEALVDNLKILRTEVIQSEFVVKPKESRVLKGVKILSTLEKEMAETEGLEWVERLLEENRPLAISNEGFKLGLQEEFLFYLKIPRIARLGSSLKKSSIEVKVASCQQIFRIIDGSQVVKNIDLIVRIVGEGEEEFFEEEDNKEVMKIYYREWGENWLFPTAILPASQGFYDEAQKLLQEYKESLGNSVVKDDKLMWEMVRKTEIEIENMKNGQGIDYSELYLREYHKIS